MRRGEAPVAVAEETCVLGHAWQDGRVLCPVCGFGRRVTPADGEAEAVTVTAVVAMPAAREGEVTAATVSPDGHWAWDGDEWVPASMSTIGASASTATATTTTTITENAEVPATQAPIGFADGDADTSTWASRDMPRSLSDVDANPDHVPSYEDREPAPIPMPFDASDTDDAPAVNAEADLAAVRQEEQTLEDLARLLAMADVPGDDDQAAATDESSLRLEPVALEPLGFEVAPVAFEKPVEPLVLVEPVHEVAAADIAPLDIAPLDIAPLDIAPLEVAPVEVASTDLASPDLASPELSDALLDATPVETAAPIDEPASDAFLAPYLEFEGPSIPIDEPAVASMSTAQTVEAPEVVNTSSSIADTTAASEPTAVKPISIVLRPSTAASDGEEKEREEKPRRSLRVSSPDLHLNTNGLRVAVVVIAAVVSTVVATGHSPFSHHTSNTPTVDTQLQGTLRAAAVLETRYASEHGDAGLSATTLTPGGYHPASTVSLSAARTSGQGFCLVGSGPVAGSHAYELWDSARGGLVSADGTAVSFPTQEAAQVACHGAGAFQAL